MCLSDLDARVVERMQRGIAVVDRPFADTARELETDEQTLIDRLRHLLDEGVLSRFGPMFNADVLGGAYTLCAMAVPEEKFGQVSEYVNGFAEVAHNYERDHAFNMWFVLATEMPEQIDAVIERIECDTGIEVLNLPKEEEYFVGLYLPPTRSANLVQPSCDSEP